MKSEASKVYDNIYTTASTWIVIIIAVYVGVRAFLADILFEEWGAVWTTALDIVIAAFLGLICWRIYKRVLRKKKDKWKDDHKEIWVEGLWLSIHFKDSIRIGTVEIMQEFDLIEATGKNTSPKGYGTDEITTWSYDMGRVINNIAGVRFDYIGCYSATKAGNPTEIKGLHMAAMTRNDKDSVYEMSGFFGDVISNKDDAKKVSAKHGQFYLFKASPDCERHLRNKNGVIDYNELRTLHTHEDYYNDPYAEKLREFIALLEEQNNNRKKPPPKKL